MSTIGLCFHFIITYVITEFFVNSLTGIAIAHAITELFQLVYMNVLTYRATYIEKSILSFNQKSFIGFKEYFRVALPSVLLFSLESQVFEFMTIQSGVISIND